MAAWYKWVDVDFCKEPVQIQTLKKSNGTSQMPTKKLDESHYEQVNKKLMSIIKEDGNQKVREQAGLDNSKNGRMRKCSGNKSGVPNVCKFQKIYERHRRELLKQIDEDLHKKRQFHSQPVPNFSRSHKRLEKQRNFLSSKQMITVPQAPFTLVKSMEARERLEAWRQLKERESMCRPRIQSHSTAYLNREPFIPKLQSSIIEVRPFRLQADERVKERKKFNARAAQDRERRIRKQVKEFAQRQKEEFLALRKLTVFKARPNPWKRFYS